MTIDLNTVLYAMKNNKVFFLKIVTLSFLLSFLIFFIIPKKYSASIDLLPEKVQQSSGFGAAIGGIGTERFKIEEVATKNSIPILAIVIKQTIQEAITLMSENIAKQAKSVRNQIYEMIEENSKSGQTVMIVGVGNTLGISQ